LETSLRYQHGNEEILRKTGEMEGSGNERRGVLRVEEKQRLLRMEPKEDV
jgi:hypothetical protein